jgi:MFS family permease
VTVLGGNATTNGLLQSARGLGSLLGALMIAAVGSIIARGKLFTVGNIVFPVLLLVFAAVRWLPFSLLAMTGVGWGFMVVANISNSLVQTQVPDRIRGRVMSIYTLTFFGLLPLGSLLAGAAADRFGEPLTVAVGGFLVLVFAIWVWIKVPELRKSS